MPLDEAPRKLMREKSASGVRWINDRLAKNMFQRLMNKVLGIMSEHKEDLDERDLKFLNRILNEYKRGNIPSEAFLRNIAGMEEKGKTIVLYSPAVSIDSEKMANIIRDSILMLIFGDKDSVDIRLKNGERFNVWLDDENIGITYIPPLPPEAIKNEKVFNSIWRWMRSHWHLEAKPTSDGYIAITYKLKHSGKGAWKRYFSHKDIENFVQLARESVRESIERIIRYEGEAPE